MRLGRRVLGVATAIAVGATLAGGALPVLAEGAAAAPGADGLTVVQVGPTIDGDYPTITVPLSVIDSATGKPLELDPKALTVVDGAAGERPVGLARATRSVPGAWVLLVDCSTSMLDEWPDGRRPLDEAKAAAAAFLDRLPPSDVVRLVTFSSQVDQLTGWVPANDPGLRATIAGLTVEGNTTISTAISTGTRLAQARPAEFLRYGVVLLTDGSALSTDKALTIERMERTLKSPVFSLSFGPPSVPDDLRKLLSDVALYTGGTYRRGDAAEVADVYGEIRRTMVSIWLATFTADGAPDGRMHELRLQVSGEGKTGISSDPISYKAGELEAVSGIEVTGLGGAEITADTDVSVAATGKAWPTTKLEFFLNCPAVSCAATETSTDGPIAYRLVARSLEQGDQTYEARLTVTDSLGKRYSTTVSGAFARRGTTYNTEFVALVLGLGFVLTAIVAMASVRRGRRYRALRADG